jgi:hypothetical protein
MRYEFAGSSWALLSGVVTVWLLWLARADLCTGETPAWATAAPLLLAGVVRSVLAPPDGALWPGGVAVTAALGMILASDTGWATLPAGVALFCAGAAGPETRVLVGCWIGALLLALLGIWGAGDGKIFATLMALFPDVRLLLALIAAVELGSVIALLRRQGRATPVVLWNVLQDALHLNFPSRTGERGDHPTVPWLALGALVYLALQWGGLG